MLLGSKPLADMSEEEMRAAIAELREAREALREREIKRKREHASKVQAGDALAGDDAPAPKAKRKEKEIDPAIANILAELMKDD